MVHERISMDPKIMFGKPVIKGTRVPVELILEDIRAAAAFAADHLATEEIVLASGTTL